jgi:hypothetical protein
MKIIAFLAIFTCATGSFGIQIPERNGSRNIGMQDLTPFSRSLHNVSARVSLVTLVFVLSGLLSNLHAQAMDGRAYNKLIESLVPNFIANLGASNDEYIAPVFTTQRNTKKTERWSPPLEVKIEEFSASDLAAFKIDEFNYYQRVWRKDGDRNTPIALVAPHTCFVKLPNQQFLYIASGRWEQSRTLKADDPYPDEVQFPKGFQTKKFIACAGVWADIKNITPPYKETLYFYAMEIEAKHALLFQSCPKDSPKGCQLYAARATLSVIARPKNDAQYILPNEWTPRSDRREYTPVAVLNLGDVIVEDRKAGQGQFARLFTLSGVGLDMFSGIFHRMTSIFR